MRNEPGPTEAAQALDLIQQRQQQVIDLATIPAWYWWAVAALMVALAAGVDTHTRLAIGAAVPVFVLGILRAPGGSHPATLACLAGGLAMGAGGPILMRRLRQIMLGNRAGSPR